MGQFARDTKVSVANSKAELERTIERYGASSFFTGWDEGKAMIAFTMENRQVRFILAMPDKTDREFTHHSRGARTTESALNEWEKACRQRWRALNLVVKAKLEAVESAISEFDDEFMANIVMPDGKTVAEHTRPIITHAYDTGDMQPLLPNYSGDE